MIEQESRIYGTLLVAFWSKDGRKTAALAELGVVEPDKTVAAMRILAIGLYDAEWNRAFSRLPATTGVSVRTAARVNAIAYDAASQISHRAWLEYARTLIPKFNFAS
jgi:hypothetical protein